LSIIGVFGQKVGDDVIITHGRCGEVSDSGFLDWTNGIDAHDNRVDLASGAQINSGIAGRPTGKGDNTLLDAEILPIGAKDPLIDTYITGERKRLVRLCSGLQLTVP
jgi:hypothetical protein